MTSQLILMNGFGVAIASDSVVTMGDARRTYETAEKIIPIEAPHRVAVLHSGAVRLQGLPYSVLVSEWASTLGGSPLRSVDQYRSSFVSWLEANQQWFSREAGFGDAVFQLEDYWRVIRDRMLDLASKQDLDTPESRILSYLRWRLDGLRECSAFESTADGWAERLWSNNEEYLTERFEYWFDDVIRSEEIDSILQEISKTYFHRGLFINRSTLAFVGYGREEILPSWSNVEIAGLLESEVLFITRDTLAGDATSSSYFGIRPLGQSSAIDLFLQGVGEGSIESARDAVAGVMSELRGSTRELLGDHELWSRVDDELERAEREMHERIHDSVWGHSETEFVRPLRSAVASLPVGDLAAAAKSLVELQALRQTTSAEFASVGGPIDVATISRAEGFRWVRHKSLDHKF